MPLFQVGSIAGAILIVVLAVVGGILYQSAWIIEPKLWVIGTIFPIAGYSLGFFLARIAGQPWDRYVVLVFWSLGLETFISNNCGLRLPEQVSQTEQLKPQKFIIQRFLRLEMRMKAFGVHFFLRATRKGEALVLGWYTPIFSSASHPLPSVHS